MRIATGLGIALVLFATAAPAATGKDGVPLVLAEQDRAVPGGRAVQVMLAQRQIYTTIDLGRVAESQGSGGLLGYMITSAMDSDRRDTMRDTLRNTAEQYALPVRRALAGFDMDSLALATTKAALTKPAWFQPTAFAPSQETGTAIFQATAGTQQLAYVDYRYEFSPDFTQIRVYADLRISRQVATKIGKTIIAPGPIYHQRILSVVQLRERSYDAPDNAAAWAAADGRLAKAGLTRAFQELENLIPYALGLRDADIAGFTAKSREKAFAASYYGPLIVRSPTESDDILIWNNGLIHIRSIS